MAHRQRAGIPIGLRRALIDRARSACRRLLGVSAAVKWSASPLAIRRNPRKYLMRMVQARSSVAMRRASCTWLRARWGIDGRAGRTLGYRWRCSCTRSRPPARWGSAARMHQALERDGHRAQCATAAGVCGASTTGSQGGRGDDLFIQVSSRGARRARALFLWWVARVVVVDVDPRREMRPGLRGHLLVRYSQNLGVGANWHRLSCRC